jgi:hypothetical protein
MNVTRNVRLWLATSLIVAVVPLTLSMSAHVAAASPTNCRAPRLTGATVTVARRDAKVAGCTLRLIGAKLQVPQVQTILRQSVPVGRLTEVVTPTVNPLCGGAALDGPPPGEPLISAGPTELISGLFIEGGPYVMRSAPTCKDVAETSSPGTITVTDAAGTVIVNREVLARGELLHVKVAPGRYTITGNLTKNNKLGPVTVKVPNGDTVRQDLTLQVP